MPEFSVGMALFDYIPCIFFGIAAIILLKDLYNVMSKGPYALFAAGVVNVFMAGTLKATWKLLVACGIGGYGAAHTYLHNRYGWRSCYA